MKELLAHAKTNPLKFGSAGAGAADHLAGELFNSLAGVRMQHVPYKERLFAMGIVPLPASSPDEFGVYISSEIRKYAGIVKATGAKVR